MRCAAERGKREFTDYLARFDPLDTAHNALMSARSICIFCKQIIDVRIAPVIFAFYPSTRTPD